ncbi:hypothetical protein ACQ4PT_013189 [Festuca glaucescens]
MTGAGDAAGDSTGGSVQFSGGKFWSLSSLVGAEDEDEISPGPSGEVAWRASPSREPVLSSSTRVAKRMEKRRFQKEAALVLAVASPEVIADLGWIVPGEHQWSLEMTEENMFKTIFPTKVDLSRYDYLALFGVGSLIVKETKVDVEFTRKHGVVRMYVQITSLVPEGTDHTYDGEGFGITFEIEGYKPPKPTNVDMEDANDNGDNGEDKSLQESERKADDNGASKEGKKDVDSSMNQVQHFSPVIRRSTRVWRMDKVYRC